MATAPDDPVVGRGVQSHRDGVRRRGGRHAPHPSRAAGTARGRVRRRASTPTSSTSATSLGGADHGDEERRGGRRTASRRARPRRAPPPPGTPRTRRTPWPAAPIGDEVGDQRLHRGVLHAGGGSPQQHPGDREPDPVGEHQHRDGGHDHGQEQQGAAADAVVGEAGAERGDGLGAHRRGVHDRDDGRRDQVLVDEVEGDHAEGHQPDGRERARDGVHVEGARQRLQVDGRGRVRLGLRVADVPVHPREHAERDRARGRRAPRGRPTVWPVSAIDARDDQRTEERPGLVERLVHAEPAAAADVARPPRRAAPTSPGCAPPCRCARAAPSSSRRPARPRPAPAPAPSAGRRPR